MKEETLHEIKMLNDLKASIAKLGVSKETMQEIEYVVSLKILALKNELRNYPPKQTI